VITSIIWDFDGVIIDSMEIKGRGFAELFKGYADSHVNEIVKYHYKNGGISRFEKIKYFFNGILKEEISEDNIFDLANRFSKIIESEIYDQSYLITETVDFIKLNHKQYNFHIVSGAEHNELNKICKYFNLDMYFISIDGSPTKKKLLVKKLFDKYCYLKAETVLIGDSNTDYEAASNNNIRFFGFRNPKLRKVSAKYIDSFKSF
jgi:HAD superfamily hydrolase (TIGR01549 family)